jgi:hypothetical protein
MKFGEQYFRIPLQLDVGASIENHQSIAEGVGGTSERRRPDRTEHSNPIRPEIAQIDGASRPP